MSLLQVSLHLESKIRVHHLVQQEINSVSTTTMGNRTFVQPHLRFDSFKLPLLNIEQTICLNQFSFQSDEGKNGEDRLHQTFIRLQERK